MDYQTMYYYIHNDNKYNYTIRIIEINSCINRLFLLDINKNCEYVIMIKQKQHRFM